MRNEIRILPFFIRHYSAFSDQIHLFDDGSDDGSAELATAHPKVTVHPISGGLDEAALLELAHESYPMARGKADWCMWPDIDEFVYHPRISTCLQCYDSMGCDMVRPAGFNLVGRGLPTDDGVRQIWELLRTGVPAPVYSKPIVFKPDAEIQWGTGKHSVHRAPLTINPWGNLYVPDSWRLRLLHYRYLGREYTHSRNARQFERSTNKQIAWSCAPDYTGEHGPDWADRMISSGYDVVCPEAAYRAVKGVWPKLPTDL